ncbi:MAG: hypothetical protein PHF56_03875 [Desulfuromonadaceae bacterium]|nr:hypothetical protein [Desulfuromonadaceae bacterium]
MLKEEVPQDKELFGDQSGICYALDANGRYVLAEFSGWEPANIANSQAWEAISLEVADILAEIRAGKRSPLAYHMVANQMDEKLLAEYTGLFRWQVRRHLRPGPFNGISAKLRGRYASLFSITAEELGAIPDTTALARLQTAKLRSKE